MWFWIAVVGYLVGASLTFRWQFLARTEQTERAIDKRQKQLNGLTQGAPTASAVDAVSVLLDRANEDANNWRMQDRFFSTVLAMIWPPVVLFFLWGKILFPRGVNTRYATQKARIAELENGEAEYKKHLEMLQVDGYSTSSLAELAIKQDIANTRQLILQMRSEISK